MSKHAKPTLVRFVFSGDGHQCLQVTDWVESGNGHRSTHHHRDRRHQ